MDTLFLAPAAEPVVACGSRECFSLVEGRHFTVSEAQECADAFIESRRTPAAVDAYVTAELF